MACTIVPPHRLRCGHLCGTAGRLSSTFAPTAGCTVHLPVPHRNPPALVRLTTARITDFLLCATIDRVAASLPALQAACQTPLPTSQAAHCISVCCLTVNRKNILAPPQAAV
ncbi:hypothetical protein DUNSADRAFT_16114 [Dunaliella salina]|uniref:Encoded protein n=1 Tax=Dunaliella salina TaxID=3046 RepID=A0ABQ7H172_DUNSA|nr:hypothetical protein DUNSADRAFT_16114 [Dunaliella salina]|eukprot:KAF5840599.1 hypothetical protein DUNSADRAFT_16114 [Dunaliella salina]